MTAPRLLAAFATVGGWTMASRVLGFLRDILIAALLGAGPVAEAFFVAFRLPNMFRRFFAEGAFNTAFVPLYAKRLEGEGPAAARAFAEEAMAGLLTALLILTVLAQVAMPWFVLALASGFADDPERFDLAVALSRICFPYIVFISLAALVSGILNAHNRFAAAAAAPVLLNIVLSAVLGIAWATGLDRGTALAWGVAVAGVAQLGLLLAAIGGIDMRLRLRRPRWTPRLRRLVRLGIPAALAGGVMQINLLVGTQVASYFDGAVAWLWLADRVYQLPLGVVGVAIGVVLLPNLARQLRAGDEAGAKSATNRAAEFALVLTLPATMALMVIPGPITAALFERGAFTAPDTAATATALLVYAAGLPAYVLLKVVQPAFFARENTAAPLRYAAASMVVNVVVAVGLMPVLGFLSAALGTVLAAWINLALLWRGARTIGADLAADERLRARLPRMVLATAGMGLGLWATEAALTAAGIGGVLGLLILVITGLGAYGGLAAALGAVRRSDLRSAIRRG